MKWCDKAIRPQKRFKNKFSFVHSNLTKRKKACICVAWGTSARTSIHSKLPTKITKEHRRFYDIAHMETIEFSFRAKIKKRKNS